MRRKLTIAALAAMLLAAGGPALAQSPNQLQVQPRILIQPRLQFQQKLKLQPRITKPPTTVRIKPSQALIIAQRMVPNSKAVKVMLLPGGNYAVTLKSNNRVQRVFIDGDTGVPR